MGDGYFTLDKTITLCTESFDLNDIQLLINALNQNFGIIASMQKRVSSSQTIG